MAEDNPKYNIRFKAQAQGFAVGDNNIIYNYFGYGEEVVSTAPVDATDDNAPCPYRGLYHFTPNDAEYFFGRDIFVERLFQATQNRNFIPVLGASGSGKSSVVLAGLVPKLEERGHWKFTHFRPGLIRKKERISIVDPFYALATALVPLYTPHLNETKQLAQASDLANFLRNGKILLSDVIVNIQKNYPNHRVLLIADQFEELYTVCDEEKLRCDFLNILIDNIYSPISSSQSSFVLVLTMRADFLGSALSYRPFADVLQNADIKLGAMNSSELSEVIEKPAKKLGVSFEAGLVKKILGDVEDEPGNLPLLEFALTELWKKRTGKQLTHNAYEAIGQVKKALANYAEQKYEELGEKEKKQARQIFTQLVNLGEDIKNTRRSINRNQIGKNNWKLVIRQGGLADSRLVITNSNNENEQTLEIIHEALIFYWNRLRQWLDESRKQLMLIREIELELDKWQKNGQSTEYLLPAKTIERINETFRECRDEFVLSYQINKFIKESINEQNYQRKVKLTQKYWKNSARFGIPTIILIFITSMVWFQNQNLQERIKIIAYAFLNPTISPNEVIELTPELLKLAKEDLAKINKFDSQININNMNSENIINYYSDNRLNLEAIDYYQNNRDSFNKFLSLYSRIMELSLKAQNQLENDSELKEKLIYLFLDAEKFLVYLTLKYRIPELAQTLQENDKNIPIKVTEEILMAESGVKADLNNDGNIDTSIEAALLPCKILEIIELLWKNASDQRCGWYGSEGLFDDNDCNELPKNSTTLAMSVFDYPEKELEKRLESCGLAPTLLNR